MAPGSRDRLKALGPRAFAASLRDSRRPLLTDTTLRDAHQSLFATRMRSRDILAVAPHYARLLPQLLSVECWGGATFDVALRFLKEDPWERLADLRAAVPNILLQMLLRSSNAVGYANYPDDVVRFFVHQAALGGVDLFRVFDSLNWVDNMRVAIDAVVESGKLCEAALCYTGDLTDPARTKYDLRYYIDLAKQLERAGAHILGIKDMAGLELDCVVSRRLGYDGRTLIYPGHLELARKTYAPSAESIRHYTELVRIFDANLQSGSAAIVYEGKMIDYAMYKKAKIFLKNAAMYFD